MHCTRCKGLMAYEPDLSSGNTRSADPDAFSVMPVPAFRCLNCGDLIDATILRHRRQVQLDREYVPAGRQVA